MVKQRIPRFGMNQSMKPAQQTYRHRILKVQLHIQEHLDEDLSLDQLAKIAHFSPYHFHRIFKSMVGEGVKEYVKRLRLEMAAMLLKSTAHPVLQIALECGYEAHEAFSRAFRQMFGMSPSQFREEQRMPGFSFFSSVEGTMSSDTSTREVRIVEMEPLRVAFMRHVGPYQDCGPTFQQMMAYAGRHGLFGPETLCIGIGHDDPEVTAPEKLRFDACVTVGEGFQPEGEVGAQTIEGGTYAVVTHQGSYDGLAEVYAWLYGAWLPNSGREPGNSPPFEVYRNMDTSKPEEMLTDIYMSLKE